MSLDVNKTFVAYIVDNCTREEIIEKLAIAITNRDDIINSNDSYPVVEWEDRMGGQFTKQEIEDAKGGW